ncbi:MAG: class II aldolase/adducin family protein [Pseudomonadota bacterium]
MDINKAKQEVINLCRKIYNKGWAANHDGNITIRVQENLVVATPTAESKDDITEDMLIGLDLTGKQVFGTLKPFSEFNLHIACYKNRPDISTVIHSHAPYASAYAIVNKALDIVSMPEVVVSIGAKIPITEFAMPGSEESYNEVDKLIKEYNTLLLSGNGVLSVGQDPTQAFLRMELVEHFAKINQIASTIGHVRSIGQQEIDVLLEKRKKAGLDPKFSIENKVFSASTKIQENSNTQELEKIITEEVMKLLEH